LLPHGVLFSFFSTHFYFFVDQQSAAFAADMTKRKEKTDATKTEIAQKKEAVGEISFTVWSHNSRYYIILHA